MVLDLARTLKDAARLGGRGLLTFGRFCMAHSLDTSRAAAAAIVVVSYQSIGAGMRVMARASTSSMRETGTISSAPPDAVRDFDKVLGVLFGDEHRLDAPTQGREQLLFETDDRPYAAAQRNLAGHGEVTPHGNSGHHRDDSGDHGDAGRRSVLRCRALGQVNVYVTLVKQGPFDA